MSTSTMRIAGLDVPISPTSKGPRVADHVAEVEPLAWWINHALEGSVTDFRESLERGRALQHGSLRAVPDGEGRYHLSGGFFTATMTLPAATILEVYATLAAQQIAPPPRVVPPPTEADPPRPPPVRLPPRPDLPRSWTDLETRAAELDQLVTRDRTLDHLVEESAKRRFLLLDLADEGVFNRDFEPPDGLPTIAAYAAAARQLGHYLESEERARFNVEAPPTEMLGAPVSLDWYRVPGPPGPDHLSPLEWLAFLENILRRNDVLGGHGSIMVRAGGWWSLHWRTDDGVHPAVVSAAPIGD
jgi:hypothetical protein